MNIEEYQNQYRKAILKQSLKMGIELKKQLYTKITFSNNKEQLEEFKTTYNFKEKMEQNQELDKILGDQEEFEELLIQDMVMLKELKELVDEKIESLKDSEKEEIQEDEKDDNSEEDRTETTSNDEKDEEKNTAEEITINAEPDQQKENNNTERDTSKTKNGVETAKTIGKSFLKLSLANKVSTPDILKLQLATGIIHLMQIRKGIEEISSLQFLEELQSDKWVFESAIGFGQAIQSMKDCDATMFLLSTCMIKLSVDVLNSLDRKLEEIHEQLHEQMEKRMGEKGDLPKTKAQTMEDIKENSSENTEENDNDIDKEENVEIQKQENNTEFVEQDGQVKTNKKDWELSPDKKIEIQKNSSEIGRRFEANIDSKGTDITIGNTISDGNSR